MFAPPVVKPKSASPQRPVAVAQKQLLQRSIGNQATLRRLAERGIVAPTAARPIQAKLKIGAVNDPLEHEADRVADQVMRMPAPEVSATAAPPQVSRKCADCEEEKLQRKSDGLAEASSGEAPASVHQVLSSPGQPLDAATRTFFEPRFGRDFSRVRVHTDASAEHSAGDVDARAYTVGQNIVFGSGRYAPGTPEGRRLIAHELTHVTQQKAVGLFRQKEGKDPPPPPKTPPPPAKTEAPPAATTAAPCVPKFKSLKAEITSKIGVRDFEGKCSVMLGTPGKANGTTITSKVDVPAGCTGTLQYVQLVDMCRGFHLTNGKDFGRKTDVDFIDTKDPIDDKQVASAGSVEFSTNDSPGQPVVGAFESIKVHDSFKTWLMWKPDHPADAPRVPLAMVTWSWSAAAKAKKGSDEDCIKHWTLTQSKAAGGVGKATKDSPAATKTVAPQEPPPVEGQKC